MRWILVVALVLGSSAAGGQQPSTPAPLSKEQQDRLKEAARCGTEARKLFREGKLAEAIAEAQKMLAIKRAVLGNWHDDVAGSLELLAALHEYHDEFDTARKEWREVIAIRVKLYGEANWRAANARRELGYVDVLERATPGQRKQLYEAVQLTHQFLELYEQGKWREAEPLGRRVLAIRRELLGEKHATTAFILNHLGRLYLLQAEYAQAESLFRQALAIRREVLGEKYPAYADVINNLGRLAQARADYAHAESLHRQALAIRREVLGEHHADYAQSLNNLALVYQARADYAQARQLFEGAAAVFQQSRGDRHPDYATILNNLAALYQAQGEYAQADRHYQRALAIRRETVAEQHPDYAQTLNDLAVLRQIQGDFPQAERLFLRALDIRRRALGEQHPAYATTLNDLALLYQAQGDLSRPERLFHQALAICRQAVGEKHPGYATTLGNLALLYEAQSEYTRAEPLHQQTLEIRRQSLGARHPHYAASLLALAALYRVRGDYARAEPLCRQALEIDRHALGDRHPNCATALESVAALEQARRNYTGARRLFQGALALRREAQGERHPAYARSLNLLAELYRAQHNYVQAEPLQRQALEIRRQVLGERHPEYAVSLNNLALIYKERGDYAGAEPLYQQALEVQRQVLGERHLSYAISLGNLALLYRDRGDLVQAEPLFRRAIVALCQTEVAPPVDIARLRPEDFKPLPISVQTLLGYGIGLERRAEATTTAAELRTCNQVYTLAADLLDRVRTEVLQERQSKTLQGEKASELFPRRIGVLRQLYALEGRVADLEMAFTTAEQGTARVFLEVLGEAQARIVGGVPPELLAQEHQLVRSLRLLDQRIETEASQPPDRLKPELIGQLQEERKQREAELKALLARLEKEYPQYAALMHPRPCSLAQARACLTPSEVALLFVPGVTQSYVVVVEARAVPDDRANGLAIYPLPAEKELANLVEALTDPQTLILPARARSQGRKAYQQLLAPLKEQLHGKDLAIVPGGPLGYLPFELLVGPDGKFLPVESRHIRYAPSLTALHMVRRWEKDRRRPDQPLWGLGDPVFDLQDPRVQGKGTVTGATQKLLNEYRAGLPRSGYADRPVFERLPATATEVAAIRETLQAQPEVVLTGLQASEGALKAASEKGILARTRFVHFATHGILGVGPGRQPALVFSLVGNDTEDGFLQLDEVTRLKLNADLVVLSACQSGQGRLARGEGVSSLARAFLYAGSRGVLCSLWSVNDEATARLMQQLYSEVQAGQSTADALRIVQRAMIRDGQAPFFWAPFILIGE